MSRRGQAKCAGISKRSTGIVRKFVKIGRRFGLTVGKSEVSDGILDKIDGTFARIPETYDTTVAM